MGNAHGLEYAAHGLGQSGGFAETDIEQHHQEFFAAETHHERGFSAPLP